MPCSTFATTRASTSHTKPRRRAARGVSGSSPGCPCCRSPGTILPRYLGESFAVFRSPWERCRVIGSAMIRARSAIVGPILGDSPVKASGCSSSRRRLLLLLGWWTTILPAVVLLLFRDDSRGYKFTVAGAAARACVCVGFPSRLRIRIDLDLHLRLPARRRVGLERPRRPLAGPGCGCGPAAPRRGPLGAF